MYCVVNAAVSKHTYKAFFTLDFKAKINLLYVTQMTG